VSLSIRARLTLWYTVVLTLALALCGGLFYVLHTRARLAQVDAELARAEALLSRAVSAELEEGLDLAAAAPEVVADVEMPGLFLGVFDEAGGLLSGPWGDLPTGGAGETPPPERARATEETGAGRFRVLRTWHREGGIVYGVGGVEVSARGGGSLRCWPAAAAQRSRRTRRG